MHVLPPRTAGPADDPFRPPFERLLPAALGRRLAVERPADLEALWEAMTDEQFREDERIPYWADLWPACLALCAFMENRAGDLVGRVCLDLGCGLGLAGIVAALLGGRVLGLDHEWPAVRFSRHNAGLNGLDGPDAPLWTLMDWRTPALKPGCVQVLLGGDILYERRFFEPLSRFIPQVLAPDGRAWLAEPRREVARPAWETLAAAGLAVRAAGAKTVPGPTVPVTADIWELTWK